MSKRSDRLERGRLQKVLQNELQLTSDDLRKLEQLLIARKISQTISDKQLVALLNEVTHPRDAHVLEKSAVPRRSARLALKQNL